ncbi:MAG TPA: SdpI family protein [Gemmatimonadales bacterium]|nr:SdpI family protein [Gemmatimonadales bacterium]
MRSRWFGLVIAALALAISIWAYPSLPPRVATHWNLHGTPDGFSSRFVAVAIGPLLVVGIALLFNVLPKVDPRRENYVKFLSTYWLFANAVIAFMLIMHGVVIATGLGYAVRIDRLMPLFIGLLFVIIGNYLTRVEPNWFVGIRTPWTLSSDTVWRKTHRTGGWLMVLGGLALASGAFLPGAVLLPLFIVTIVVVAVIPIVQSYVLWKREQGARSREQT